MNDEPETASTGILYVDDETKALKYFEKAFGKEYHVRVAESAAAGMEILETEHADFAIVVSDQRMPGTQGVEFLTEVRELYPDKIRILTTAYSDLESAIQSVNQGRIYQYVVKPWDLQDFRMVLRRARDFHAILRERDHLLSVKMSMFQRIVLTDRSRTLAAIARALAGPSGGELLAALFTLLRALPDTIDARPGATGEAVLRGGLTDLLRQEKRAHDRLVDFWRPERGGTEVLLERFRAECANGNALGEPLECDPKPEGETLRIVLGPGAARRDRTLHALFGALVEAEPSEASLLFLGLLGSLADSGRTVLVETTGDEAGAISFHPLHPPEEEKLEEVLLSLYERWDVQSLGGRRPPSPR